MRPNPPCWKLHFDAIQTHSLKTTFVKRWPYWWETSGAEPARLSSEHLPDEVDMLVIGGGLTGLSAARTLAKAGNSVLVLEAGSPGIGASSRNGGLIGGGSSLPVILLRERYGRETAAALIREMHIDATEFAIGLMNEERIDCEFKLTGRFLACWHRSDYELHSRNLEEVQKLAPVEAEMIPKSRQHEQVASDLYNGGLLHALHGGLHPAKWVAGMLRSALSAGAIVCGNTLVHSLERRGTAQLAETQLGPILAGKVLVATNGYNLGNFGRINRSVIPIPSFIIVSEELGRDLVQELFPSGGMIVETRERHCYFRPTPKGDRVLFGARAALFDAPNWLADRELQSLLAQIFPQLKGIGITHSWRGYTGFTFGMMPNIGNSGAIWHALGYCGNGNAMAPWLGHKAALQMLGDPDGESVLSKTGLPTRWWYNGWPWFRPFADVAFRIRDAVSNVRRKREYLDL